jgi:hypothetical protein
VRKRGKRPESYISGSLGHIVAVLHTTSTNEDEAVNWGPLQILCNVCLSNAPIQSEFINNIVLFIFIKSQQLM